MTNIYGPLMLWPLGNFGDSIVTAGLIRHFASLSPKIYLPVKLYNNNDSLIKTVQLMFSDLKNLEVIEHFDTVNYDQLSAIYNASRIRGASIYTIEHNNTTCCPMWDEQWYTWFSVPFSARYSNFKIPDVIPQSKELYDQVVDNKDYILVHNQIATAERDVSVDLVSWRPPELQELFDKCQVIVINPSMANNLLYYIDLIKNAKEIHCVPSSMFCLVDSIVDKTNATLYYHNIRANTLMRVNNQWNNHRWTFVNYSNKV